MPACLEPLARAGTVCRLVLSGAERTVGAASGACARLLGQPPQALCGRPAALLLEGASRLALEDQGACEVSAVQTGRPLLAYWARAGERVEVLLLDAAPLSPSRQAGSADGFAGAAAHDLRNPLATVKLNLQVLARQPAAGGDERTARRLAIALREVETLERGLEALAECGRARVPVAVPAELPRALDEVARRLAPELGASPRVEAEAGLPRLAVDEGRLALALSGLARLAARDGLEGEVVLCGRAGKGPGRVRVEVRKEGLEPPARRCLAVALAQRVAEDAGGQFRVERHRGGARLVLDLAAWK